MIKSVNDVSNLNFTNKFCVYNRKANKNIIFLGSCRLVPLMYYYSLLVPDVNIYCIYVPAWDNQRYSTFPKQEIESIIPNTTLIITETIKHLSIFNTNRCSVENFFQTFNLNVSEIRVPNFVLSLYLYDIFHKELDKNFVLSEDTDQELTRIFKASRLRLASSINNSNFNKINTFIDENFTTIKMFSTINHPTTILSMLTFKLMSEQLGINSKLITFDFLKHISNYHFLSGNSTPITNWDIENYGFKFKTKVFTNNIIDNINFCHSPTEEENFISNKQLKIILSIT